MKIIKLSAVAIAMLTLNIAQGQDKELKQLEKRFHRMDANADKTLSQGEVDNFFKDKTTKSGAQFKTKKMFAKWDKNEDGKVNLKEYIAHMTRKN